MSATNARLNCFVAMAFGQPDTDRLYKRHIKPLEEEFPIRIVRVDQKEHNREIDTVIIEELNEADFLISDLTYARPSVYYESGYAERKVPVIYTARDDHLQSRAGDPDNLRVHFDLLMKNIIGWRSEHDGQFSQRLRKRVKHVLRPLLQDRAREETRKQEIAAFSAYSNMKKELVIRRAMQAVLKSLGYQRVTHDVFLLYQQGVVSVVQSTIMQSIAPRRFAEHLQIGLFDVMAERVIANDEALFKIRGRIKTIEQRIFLCSWNKIPVQKLKDQLNDVSSTVDGTALNMLPRDVELRWHSKNVPSNKTRMVHWNTRVAVLDAIRSISEFSERARTYF